MTDPLELVGVDEDTSHLEQLEQNSNFQAAQGLLLACLSKNDIEHDMIFLVFSETKELTSLHCNFDPVALESKSSFHDRYWPFPKKMLEPALPISLFLPRAAMFVYGGEESHVHRNVGLLFWNLKRELPPEMHKLTSSEIWDRRNEVCEATFLIRQVAE
jgi:hypothetical protein